MKSFNLQRASVIGLAAVSILFLVRPLQATLELPPYDNRVPPKLALPDAFAKATATLGPKTNRFHCVSANVKSEFTREGEWHFTFYSSNPNEQSINVIVEFDGKTLIDDGWR